MPRTSKPKTGTPILNAIGKPFGANYDPAYRLRHKPSYGHLRAPYPATMKFVGEESKAVNPRKRNTRRPKPVPLLDGLVNDRADRARATATNVLAAVARALRKPAVRDAIVNAVSTEFEAIVSAAVQIAIGDIAPRTSENSETTDEDAA
jgi:hypothetical protein